MAINLLQTKSGKLTILLFVVFSIFTDVYAQEIHKRTISPDGPVFQMKRKGDILYMTGQFKKVGYVTGGAALFDEGSDIPSLEMPRIKGKVYDIVPDGSGGWYAGGDFYQVDLKDIENLIHILPDGRLDETFMLNPNGPVNALAMHGDILYVGGSFTSINGEPYSYLAGYDLQTKKIKSLNSKPNGMISDLLVYDNFLIAGGSFTQIGGVDQKSLTKIDLNTGTMVSFPTITTGTVKTLHKNGQTLYVGGDFNSNIEWNTFSENRSRLFAIDLAGNSVTNWAPVISGFGGGVRINALTSIGDTIFAGGLFTSVSGQARKNLISVDNDGNLTSFQPEPNNEIYALGNYSGLLHVGGRFTQIAGIDRPFAAQFNPATQTLTSWDIQPDWALRCFSEYEEKMIAGGEFSTLRSKERDNACAINLVNGELNDWNPNGGFLVGTGLHVDLFNDVVYLFGWDSNTSQHLKAFDSKTGENIPSLNFTLDNSVNNVIQDPNTGNIFFCGKFQQVNGQERKRLAAINSSGEVLPFSANIDGEVMSIILDDSIFFIGGYFNNVNGEKRSKLAALNLKGDLLPWSPQHNILIQNAGINIIEAFGDKVIISGSFSQIGGEKREKIAAVHPVTGAVLPWDPKLRTNSLSAAKTEGDGIFITGNGFDRMAGIEINNLAYTSLNSGLPLMVWPDLGILNVYALETYNQTLYIGGGFETLDGRVQSYFAALPFTNNSFVFRGNVDKINPKEGGNNGDVTIEITGTGFKKGTTVALGRNGKTEILPLPGSTVFSNETKMNTTFDLRGKETGPMDLIITVPGDTTYVFDKVFELVQGKGPLPWANLILPKVANIRRTNQMILNYGNTGNIDAVGVPVWLAVSPNIEIKNFGWEIIDLIDTTAIYYDSIPKFVLIDTLLGKPYNAKLYPFIIPRIPAGSSISIPITFAGPATGSYYARAWATDPMYGSPLKYFVGECFDAWFSAVTSFIPVVGCVYGVVDILLSPVMDQFYDPGFGTEAYATSYLQTIGETAIGCFLDATTGGVGRVVFEVVDVGIKYKSLYNYGEKCFTPEEKDDEEGEFVSSWDPNDKTGPNGQGTQNWLTTKRSFPYMIRFENDPEATAPAKTVIIRDTLDSKVFDLSKLELKSFSVGGKAFSIPAGKSEYKDVVDLRPHVPALVQLNVSLNQSTGELVWEFTGLDTINMQLLTEPLDGFLPPNNDENLGQGAIVFDIYTHDTISSGTFINNRASIYFDLNDPIHTNTWSVRADNDVPESTVLSLAQTQKTKNFTIQWAGTDKGSGIRYYDVLFREEGGRWKYVVFQTPDTSAEFVGEAGKFYEFYSIAYDSALNREIIPVQPEASTFIENDAITGILPGYEDLVMVYPNPTNQFLNIILANHNTPVLLKLLDLTGRVHLIREIDNTSDLTYTINLGDMSSGMYILHWECDGKKGQVKVIRQ